LLVGGCIVIKVVYLLVGALNLICGQNYVLVWVQAAELTLILIQTVDLLLSQDAIRICHIKVDVLIGVENGILVWVQIVLQNQVAIDVEHQQLQVEAQNVVLNQIVKQHELVDHQVRNQADRVCIQRRHKDKHRLQNRKAHDHENYVHEEHSYPFLLLD
jgi:hypothetical protein